MCARAIDTDALAADARAFEQQRQGISEQIGLRNSGFATEFRQAVPLCRLEFLDNVPRRMIAFREFDRHIGHVAAAAIIADALGTGKPDPILRTVCGG